GSGYRVELRLPRAQMPDKLALSAFDAAAPAAESEDVLPLLSLSGDSSAALALVAPDGMRARLLSSEGWVVSQAGSIVQAGPAANAKRRWLENFVYRSLIAPQVGAAENFSTALPRLGATEIWQALSGVPATAWHRATTDSNVVLAAAVPLNTAGETRGVLLLEQASATLPLLTNR